MGPGNNNYYAVTVMVNGVASAMTCTVGAYYSSPTTCSDTSHTLNIALGDKLNLRIVPSGGPTAATVNVTSVYSWGSDPLA